MSPWGKTLRMQHIPQRTQHQVFAQRKRPAIVLDRSYLKCLSAQRGC